MLQGFFLFPTLIVPGRHANWQILSVPKGMGQMAIIYRHPSPWQELLARAKR
jgi:hypothetical protein